MHFDSRCLDLDFRCSMIFDYPITDCRLSMISAFVQIRLRRRRDPRRRAERFAVIVDRQAADVIGHRAGLGLARKHDRDGAALDAGSERDGAAAAELRGQWRIDGCRASA
jgi:hypothetical protein